MSININHSTGVDCIKKIFKDNIIKMCPTLEENLFEFLEKICTYEEEEHKIKPLLIIGNDLNRFLSQCPFHYKSTIYTDKIEGKNFNRIIKSMVPLCNNNWYIFIDILKNEVLYGVFINFQSPVSLNFEELFFDSDITDQVGLVCIKPYEKNSFIIKSLRTEETIISFSFKSIIEQVETKLVQMKEDLLTSVNHPDRAFIDKALFRILSYMPGKVHGSLCIIVTAKYKYPNDYLNGLSVKPHLDLVDCILSTKKIHSYEDAERYYALTNLFYEFMNIDGITVLDTSGRVIGYNAFYRSSETPTEETGGARKRTFAGLCKEMKKENSNIVGIYYQSQDGNFDYVRGSQE